ncbi:hypothetical protein M885DRAFT_569410 [Pelagophyceae sp. CCMP2097]|nr:hypothetical protein M885DRAFT_569410 [Pelagophyceae sp. CCMP2097]
MPTPVAKGEGASSEPGGVAALPRDVSLALLQFGDARAACRAAAASRSLGALCGSAALWAALLRRDFPAAAVDGAAKHDYAAASTAARAADLEATERHLRAETRRGHSGGRARDDVLWRDRMMQHASLAQTRP